MEEILPTDLLLEIEAMHDALRLAIATIRRLGGRVDDVYVATIIWHLEMTRVLALRTAERVRNLQ
jgi:hypothetical protein